MRFGEAGGVEVGFGDFDDVAEIVAQATFQSDESGSWESLSRRARRRLRDKAKKWLNREAVDRMTPERLAERDPDGEVIGWLRTIAELVARRSRRLALSAHPRNKLSVNRRRTMSHIVTIETEVRDASAVQAACERLKLPAAAHGSARTL